jgi:hypothetical protein
MTFKISFQRGSNVAADEKSSAARGQDAKGWDEKSSAAKEREATGLPQWTAV